MELEFFFENIKTQIPIDTKYSTKRLEYSSRI